MSQYDDTRCIILIVGGGYYINNKTFLLFLLLYKFWGVTLNNFTKLNCKNNNCIPE